MTRPSLRRLVTVVPVTHCHTVMSLSHVAKQQLLYSALLTSHRRYSNEKENDTSRGE